MIYTLRDVNKSDVFTTDKGTFQSWAVLIDHEGQELVAQLNTKVDSKPPAVGEEIDATLTSNQHGWKLKKAWSPSAAPGGGSTGQRPYDPAKEKRITHMHAQKVAATFLQIRAIRKEGVDEPLAIQDVFKLATLIREDVEKVS